MSIFYFISSSLLFYKRFLSLFYCLTCKRVDIFNKPAPSVGSLARMGRTQFCILLHIDVRLHKNKKNKKVFNSKHGELSSSASVFQTFFFLQTNLYDVQMKMLNRNN